MNKLVSGASLLCLSRAACKRLHQSREQENQKGEAAFRKFLQASDRVDGKKSDHGPETEETLPEIQKQTSDASAQESTEVNEPHELRRAIDLRQPDSSWIDIFCDVATWPHYISQHI